jgi:hypothetical protein
MFTFHNPYPGPLRTTLREVAVANGVTISEGDVVKLANDRVSLCATNELAFGVCNTFGSTVGNAAGTTYVQVILVDSMLFETAQGALSDAATQPGDTLDINATSDGVTTSSNVDFKIFSVNREKSLVRGAFKNTTGFPF